MLRTRMSVLAALLLFASPAAAADWPYGSAVYQHDYPAAPPPSWAGYPLDDFNPSYYGGGRYREYYGFGRGYGVADFPPPLPNIPPYPRTYRTYRVNAPAALPEGVIVDQPTRAYIEMHVPADAEIWLEGAKTKQTGAVRTFVSPPLAPAQNFGYDLKVRWQQDGRAVEEKRSLTIHAGQQIVVQVPAPPAAEMLHPPAPVTPPGSH